MSRLSRWIFRLHNCRVELLASVALLILASASESQAARPSAPPPPPVRYQLQYFAPPVGGKFNSIQDMSNAGVIVGDMLYGAQWSGWIYDPAISAVQAFDLNDLVRVPDGWIIAQGVGINDHGVIVVNVELIAQRDTAQPGYQRHGMLVDTREPMVDGKWTATWLPDADPFISYARDINNGGEVLGVFTLDGSVYSDVGVFLYNTGLYDELGPDPSPRILPVTSVRTRLALSDPVAGRPAQVVGQWPSGGVFRYTDGNAQAATYTIDINADLEINGFGVFCGRGRFATKGGKYVSRPFRFDPDATSALTLLGNETAHAMMIASDINNSNDVVAFGRPTLFHSAGTFSLDALVTGTTNDVSLWKNSTWGYCQLTERKDLGATVPGFPVIGTTNSTTGALLVPVLP